MFRLYKELCKQTKKKKDRNSKEKKMGNGQEQAINRRGNENSYWVMKDIHPH